MQLSDLPDVLTLDEVADVLRLAAVTPRERRRQVRELISAGDLRAINPNAGPQRLRVSRWVVLAYIGAPVSA